MDKVITNETEFSQDVSRAVCIAKCLLGSDENYLDYILELNNIGHQLHSEIWNTEFHVFGVIASDTDHLPTKMVRSCCSKEMLKKSDLEMKEIINSYKVEVTDACNEILSKYQNVKQIDFSL